MSTLEFGNMLTLHAQYLRSFAMKFTQDADDAKDLLQDTFVKAMRYRDNFREGTNIRGWLYTIMKNTFINNYKRRIFQKTISDSTNNTYFIDSSVDQSRDNVSSGLGEKEIWRHIGELSPDYRVPFSMFVEGFHYDEIADHLGIPMGTVKSRIFNARKRLSSQLQDFRV